MNRACWEQRKATTAPKSPGSPIVRIGLPERWASMAASKVIPSLAARLRAVCSTRSVAWEPGRTAFSVTPVWAISRATVFMNPVRPARAVLDRRMCGIGCFTETEVM